MLLGLALSLWFTPEPLARILLVVSPLPQLLIVT